MTIKMIMTGYMNGLQRGGMPNFLCRWTK